MDGRWRRAVKTHRCSLCWRLIAPTELTGERYWDERLTPWDHPDNDGYGQFKAHGLCLSALYAIEADDSWWDGTLSDATEFGELAAEVGHPIPWMVR